MALAVQATLKEELCRQPYAGLLALFLIDRFDQICEDDWQYWDKCCRMTADTSMIAKANANDSAELKGILRNKHEANNSLLNPQPLG